MLVCDSSPRTALIKHSYGDHFGLDSVVHLFCLLKQLEKGTTSERVRPDAHERRVYWWRTVTCIVGRSRNDLPPFEPE